MNKAYIPKPATHPLHIWMRKHLVVVAVTAAITAVLCFKIFVLASNLHFHDEAKEYVKDGEKIDLNAASPKELRRLPGIGPVYADRIVQNRPYRSVDDVLHKIPGFGRERWVGIRDFVAQFPRAQAAPIIPEMWPTTIHIKNETSKPLRFLFLNSYDGQLIVELPLAPWGHTDHPRIDESSANIAVMDRNAELCSGEYKKGSWRFTIYESSGKILLIVH